MVINEIYKIHSNNITETIEGFIEYKSELEQSKRLQNREDWSTKVNPMRSQNFRRKIYWHRIRSRCF